MTDLIHRSLLGAVLAAVACGPRPIDDDSHSTSPSEEPPPSTDEPFDSSSGGPAEPLPNGSECADDLECASGMCYSAGILGGACGDCVDDDDCEWGCTGPNPLSDPALGSFCNEGLAGDGCETSEACQLDLLCTPVIDVPGVFVRSTCGDCLSDRDCANDAVCSPDIDLPDFQGVRRCIAASSKPLGSHCDIDETGDHECASGICSLTDVMGLIQFSVCSECSTDDDCFASQTCANPIIDLDGTVTPGRCE